jgi:hypothetical protein
MSCFKLSTVKLLRILGGNMNKREKSLGWYCEFTYLCR